MFSIPQPFDAYAPTIADPHGDLSPAHVGIIPDSPETAYEQLEADIDTARNLDAGCTGCGDPTEGAIICGSHVNVCPSCLATFIRLENVWRGPIPTAPKFMKLYARQ